MIKKKVKKMSKIIGVPSSGPELSDKISPHFGHCEYFVGVEVNDADELKMSFALQNNGHSSCMEPVMNMKDRNVSDMIVGGIGGRPYMGFLQVGINLFLGVEGSVQENIELLLQGKLKSMGEPSCGGNANHAH